MDKAKVILLQRVAEINRRHDWAIVRRSARATTAEDAARTIDDSDDVHALRLSWFGLLEHRKKRSPEYRVTEYGVRFLRGKSGIPEWITVKGGGVVKRAQTAIMIEGVRGVYFDKEYWDEYARTRGGSA